MLFPLVSTTKVVTVDILSAAELARVAAFLSGNAKARVLVVKDPRPSPALDQPLAEFLAGRESLVLDRIVPNPASSDIMEMVVSARSFKPDLLVGIGGGSALDSAKAVCAMIANPGNLDDYLGPEAFRKMDFRGPKSVMIPTTTGTGAELTRFGVYTARWGRKYSLASPQIQADAAILAGSLVVDIPPALLASTAYDAVTHALETLWNRNATPVSDLVASDALVALLRVFRPAYEARLNGRNDAASAALTMDLLVAACAAGAAFNLTGTAAIHALSFILSEEWHVPHGAACAFFAETVYDFNVVDSAVKSKLASVARRAFAAAECGAGDDSAARRLRFELADLKLCAGLPSCFAELGVEASSLTEERISTLFDKCQDDFKMKNNFVRMDAPAVRELVSGKRS